MMVLGIKFSECQSKLNNTPPPIAIKHALDGINVIGQNRKWFYRNVLTFIT